MLSLQEELLQTRREVREVAAVTESLRCSVERMELQMQMMMEVLRRIEGGGSRSGAAT